MMKLVTFYRADPAHAPKPNMPAHLGANAVITCNGRLLLERRRDSDSWGLVGGGVRKTESPLEGMVREIYEELGVRVSPAQLTKLQVYGEPGRIAAFRDGSVWRMVIVVYGLDWEREPPMRVSGESRELRFFSREELPTIEIPVTHEDIVMDWFVNRNFPKGGCKTGGEMIECR